MVKRLTLAQVMISQFMGLSPASGSVLTAQSLEPASNSVSPSLCSSPAHALSLLQKINKNIKKKKWWGKGSESQVTRERKCSMMHYWASHNFKRIHGHLWHQVGHLQTRHLLPFNTGSLWTRKEIRSSAGCPHLLSLIGQILPYGTLIPLSFTLNYWLPSCICSRN